MWVKCIGISTSCDPASHAPARLFPCAAPTSSTHSHLLPWHAPSCLGSEDCRVDVIITYTSTCVSTPLLIWRLVEPGRRILWRIAIIMNSPASEDGALAWVWVSLFQGHRSRFSHSLLYRCHHHWVVVPSPSYLRLKFHQLVLPISVPPSALFTCLLNYSFTAYKRMQVPVNPANSPHNMIFFPYLV